MQLTPMQVELGELDDKVRARVFNCPFLTQVLSAIIMGFIGLLYGCVAAADVELASFYSTAPYIGLIAFGFTGWATAAIFWHSCRANFLRSLNEAVHENLLDRSLLLMALEPVPVTMLLDVFAVPGRERLQHGIMALPQAPRALNTQKFSTRLRLLRERYPAACKALGLCPWPRTFSRLQLDVELGRIYLPVIAVAVIGGMSFLSGMLDLPQSISLLAPAIMLSLLVMRWALGDILRTLTFAALNGAVVKILGGNRNVAEAVGGPCAHHDSYFQVAKV